jgi:hypothetical protein
MILSALLEKLLHAAFDLRGICSAYAEQIISARMSRKDLDQVFAAHSANKQISPYLSVEAYFLFVPFVSVSSIKLQHRKAPLYPRTKSGRVLRALLKPILVTILFSANLDKSFARSESVGPYKAVLQRLVGGNTFVARIEIWPAVCAEVSVRAKVSDTPETSQPQYAAELALWLRATEFVSVERGPG